MNRRDIPNLITILRVFLTVPVIWMLLEREFGWALLLFGVAGVSDGLDGFLAKRFGWESRLGSLLDPLADKALLVSSFLSLGWLGLIPTWLVLLVLLRDLVIVTGALVYHFQVEDLEAAPSRISKLNTLTQILLVLGVVCAAGPVPIPGYVLAVLIWATLATTLASGADYVWTWGRKAVDRGWHR